MYYCRCQKVYFYGGVDNSLIYVGWAVSFWNKNKIYYWFFVLFWGGRQKRCWKWRKVGYYIGIGFNRNILGCKERCFICSIRKPVDLIETYWDVKVDIFCYSIHVCIDLIETYWDVKICARCESVSRISDLIETYWDVKVLQPHP